LEEIRRQARENWLQLRQKKIDIELRSGHARDTDRSARNDQDRAIDHDFGD